MIITIDGPVGSGKSSAARLIAKRLNIYYLNTGLLYRGVAYVFLYKLRKPITVLADSNFCTEEDLKTLDSLKYVYLDGEPHLFYREQNLTPHLMSSELSQAASMVSANSCIREKLLPLQREVGKNYDIVAEGRDCGSVVFPNADFKFFLTASLEERARRVVNDKKRKLTGQELEVVKKELEVRDERDKNRKVSPLQVPQNAIIIDNTDMSLLETVEEILRQIKK